MLRIAIFLTLTALFLILLIRQPRTPVEAQPAAPERPQRAAQATPPPMFSPWYVESLRDTLELEEADAARLERQLAKHPEDFRTRAKLLAYHQRGDRLSRPEDLTKRRRLVFWLIENDPQSEILHSPLVRFSKRDLAAEDYRRALKFWQVNSESNPRNAAIQWNAASFFEELDRGLYLHYLESTAAADPNHPFALRPLAHLYALAILNNDPLAARAKEGLESSKNIWVLGNAAYMLQSQHNLGVQAGVTDRRVSELAEHYFLRAKAIEPSLDRNAILPQVDLAAVAKAHRDAAQSQRDWEARAAAEVGNIRRVPIDAFPDLPPAIAGVLRARRCKIPQPLSSGPPRNVVNGDFIGSGQTGWAVLCSVNNATDFLVFRDGQDTRPYVINHGDDQFYLQFDRDRAVYSREITTVGRDFILGHYRAYGGPEPPPITHQGIDDGFLEKASITWYFHDGKWLQLQGAD